jgi:hypothetical protein
MTPVVRIWRKSLLSARRIIEKKADALITAEAKWTNGKSARYIYVPDPDIDTPPP